MTWLQRSLHRRILVALAFVALFSIVTLGIVAYMTQRDALQEQFRAELYAVADSKRAQIVTWLTERKSDVAFLGENPFTRQQLAALLSPTVTTADKRTYAALLSETLWNMQRSRMDYSRILIADPAGTILISPEKSLIGRKVANFAALTGTIDAGTAPVPDVYIQGISFNEQSGKYEMCFGHVIYDPNGVSGESSSVMGVLLITTDMDESIYKILDEWRMGETGTAVLSRAEAGGTRILNYVRFDETKPLERFLPLEEAAGAKPAQLAALGHTGTALTKDHLGKPVITVYQSIPEVGWGLVLKMNTSEIFAPLYLLLLQVLLLAFGVLLLATWLSWLIAKTLVNPIEQLLAATRAVANGDLSVAVASNRQDEIGTLARAFSEMVVRLEHHQRQLKAVNQIATGILGAHPYDDVLHNLVQAASQLTNAEGAVLLLEDDGSNNDLPLLRVAYTREEKSVKFGQSDGTAALFTSGNGTDAPLVIPTLPPTAPATLPNAILKTPIQGRERRLGTLLLYTPSGDPASNLSLSQADQETLAALANYAAIVVENDRLVTELKRWNSQLEAKVADRTRELEAVNAQLTVLDEMKTEFIYSVSHELRNPITNLKLQLDLLRNNANSPRRERYITAIAKQVDLMALLIGDMLDLIQIDKMQNQMEFSAVDLNLLVADVAGRYQTPLVEQTVCFAVESTDHPLLIIGEQVQLRRAIAHLIRNAINYTNRGKICVRTFRRNGQACIQVTDTGIGIADTDLPYIFQRFYRGTNVSQSTIPGSGLGLSLVQEVAKLHHGVLEVESQLNQGSTFYLWFPAREPVSARAVVAR